MQAYTEAVLICLVLLYGCEVMINESKPKIFLAQFFFKSDKKKLKNLMYVTMHVCDWLCLSNLDSFQPFHKARYSRRNKVRDRYS